MPPSALGDASSDRSVTLRATPYDSPAAQDIVAAVQQEYVVRYGGIDETPVDPTEFVAPEGYFVLAYVGDVAIGCGGWRAHQLPGRSRPDAEIKRMFVADAARRRGVARLILADLERSAAIAGLPRTILETGDQQPEAIALYLSAGYQPVVPFGFYRHEAGSRHFGKALNRRSPAQQKENATPSSHDGAAF